LVEELLDLRADPNCPDSRQATPLHLASASGQLNVVRVLVRKGADLHAVNADGKNAAGVAKLNSRSVLPVPCRLKKYIAQYVKSRNRGVPSDRLVLSYILS
jgi:ankyrin repeat protein